MIITFVEAQAIWLVDDDILQHAYVDLLTNYDHLKYLAKFKFLETHLSRIMTAKVTWVVLDLLSANRYVPSVIVIHVGALDFGSLPNHLISHTVTDVEHRHLLCKAQPFTHMHLRVFASHMLPLQ